MTELPICAPRLIECPIVGLNRIDNREANRLLVEWGHKLGPCNRPFLTESFALEVNGEPVAVAMSCSIVHGPVAGYTTQEVVEFERGDWLYAGVMLFSAGAALETRRKDD